MASLDPSRRIEPFPNCFSIWLSVTPSARLRSFSSTLDVLGGYRGKSYYSWQPFPQTPVCAKHVEARPSTKLHKLTYRTACWRARLSMDFRAATAKERLRELLQLGTRRDR